MLRSTSSQGGLPSTIDGYSPFPPPERPTSVIRKAWVLLLLLTAAYLIIAQSHAQAVALRVEETFGLQGRRGSAGHGARKSFLAMRSSAPPEDSAGASTFPRTTQGHDLTQPRVLSAGEVDGIRGRLSTQVGGRKYTNCSVVGNDSSMRNSHYGGVIDGGGVVYRMNFAPLKEFKEHVGSRTHTECLNPEKMRRILKKQGGGHDFATDTGERPRVLVVGDVEGSDATGLQGKGPCLERSPGGLCIRRVQNERVESMYTAVQDLTEELLVTMQSGIGEEDGVPTTGLYCLVLALSECEVVDVYGIGAGTLQKTDLNDLEYFKDEGFRGWDARHNAEAERTLLRVLASQVWKSSLTEALGSIRWHNPLSDESMVNQKLVDTRPCTSGIHC